MARRGAGALWAAPLATLLSLALWPLAECYEEPTKFVIVSNGASGRIMYGRLSEDGTQAAAMSNLVEDGLQHPQGVAVDPRRSLLYVADSGLAKVVSYKLRTDEGKLRASSQKIVVDNFEARWVAVDSRGNLYYTNEVANTILRVSAPDLVGGSGPFPPAVVLDQATVSSISAPGGLASDSFFVYWVNKVNGDEAGSVVRALPAINPGVADPQTGILSKTTPKAYGLCLAANQLFFTDSSTNVWAVPKGSTDTAAVLASSNFSSPRGCAWDGSGLVYVADRSAGAVFAIPAPRPSLAKAPVQWKVADVQDAFGVAVYSRAPGLRPGAVLLLIYAACIAFTLKL